MTPAAVQPGDLVPAIDLPDWKGDRWHSEDHRGRPILLILSRHLA